MHLRKKILYMKTEKSILSNWLIACLAISSFFLSQCKPTEKHTPASLVLTNGRIWTGIDSADFVEAVAIRDSVIVATGSSEEMKSWIDDRTEVIDLQGKLATAGFNDAHIHFLGGSLGLTEVEMSSTKSLEEVINSVKDFMVNNPAKEWITGRGWQYTFFESGLPDHTTMKELQIDKPVFIKAYDGHSAWANRKALQLAGVDTKTVFTGFGELVKDKNGEPTGALKEDAMQLVGKLVPVITYHEQLDALRKGMKLAASLGITSIQNANGTELEINLFKDLIKNREVTVRYAAAFSVDETITNEKIARYTFLKDSIGEENNFLRADAIKFMIDGVIEGHTGAMIEPYSDVSATAPEAHGQLSMPLPRYRELVKILDAKGFRIYTHAIGDLGVRESLNAYEQAAQENKTTNRRHRIEHIETISPDDLPRFHQLSVMASMEPIHADPGTVTVWENAIGKKRLPYSFAWNKILQNKAQLVYSSDWPAAISINPIRGIHVAINRRTPSGFPEGGWVSEQRIKIHQALKAYTWAGAYSSFEENKKGLVKPGYLADVIVFSQDLFTIDPMKIHETTIAMTVFNGKVIYKK
jgi:predicted amidohydrolase YtcJ